ncbi:helix-turn-helix transcriptional regulator [Lacticaseibacillus paracasei]|nr:helix-turn-helix transcriptional regulator [Lacticaseibacillus paracasei]
MMSFGERLKELRNEKKMTQSDIGKIINVSKASVSLYEKNERTPDQDSIKKLASYFNVSTDFLLGVTDVRSKPEQIDISDSKNDTIMTFEGRPIPPEDLEIIKRLLRGGKHDD